MIIEQLSVFIEDKTGRLTEMTKILAENNINISAFSIADAADFGIVRMIVNNPIKAKRVLKENKFSVNITEVVCLVVPHESGGLYKALQILSKNNVPVDYMYAFALENKASVIIRSSSNDMIIKVLQEHKIELLKASDIYSI
ncbi:ACT domain-containing protein [uncultured Sunxiuqinia sp.]|uniref:ACT domain-containing protein n=1 Tax=uncultured Sunxiuqinia sp. TaxID=1573825 RepID=UPI002AA704A5|nr:ACT domain-containing protein [uncultured Sunxiuqinia sp.]